MERNNNITAEYLRSILNYDPETGVFTWKRRSDARPQWNATYVGKVAGSIKEDGRVFVAITQEVTKIYRAHRLAWLYMTGDWPKDQIDHINGNPSDNSFANLREASCQQNVCNRGAQSNGSTGIKGVSWHKAAKKWHARITVRGKTINLGLFTDINDAAKAYADAAPIYHGEFARAS